MSVRAVGEQVQSLMKAQSFIATMVKSVPDMTLIQQIAYQQFLGTLFAQIRQNYSAVQREKTLDSVETLFESFSKTIKSISSMMDLISPDVLDSIDVSQTGNHDPRQDRWFIALKNGQLEQYLVETAPNRVIKRAVTGVGPQDFKRRRVSVDNESDSEDDDESSPGTILDMVKTLQTLNLSMAIQPYVDQLEQAPTQVEVHRIVLKIIQQLERLQNKVGRTVDRLDEQVGEMFDTMNEQAQECQMDDSSRDLDTSSANRMVARTLPVNNDQKQGASNAVPGSERIMTAVIDDWLSSDRRGDTIPATAFNYEEESLKMLSLQEQVTALRSLLQEAVTANRTMRVRLLWQEQANKKLKQRGTAFTIPADILTFVKNQRRIYTPGVNNNYLKLFTRYEKTVRLANDMIEQAQSNSDALKQKLSQCLTLSNASTDSASFSQFVSLVERVAKLDPEAYNSLTVSPRNSYLEDLVSVAQQNLNRIISRKTADSTLTGLVRDRVELNRVRQKVKQQLNELDRLKGSLEYSNRELDKLKSFK